MGEKKNKLYLGVIISMFSYMVISCELISNWTNRKKDKLKYYI